MPTPYQTGTGPASAILDPRGGAGGRYVHRLQCCTLSELAERACLFVLLILFCCRFACRGGHADCRGHVASGIKPRAGLNWVLTAPRKCTGTPAMGRNHLPRMRELLENAPLVRRHGKGRLRHFAPPIARGRAASA